MMVFGVHGAPVAEERSDGGKMAASGGQVKWCHERAVGHRGQWMALGAAVAIAVTVAAAANETAGEVFDAPAVAVARGEVEWGPAVLSPRGRIGIVTRDEGIDDVNVAAPCCPVQRCEPARGGLGPLARGLKGPVGDKGFCNVFETERAGQVQGWFPVDRVPGLGAAFE